VFLFRIIGPILLLVLVYWGLQRFSKRHALTTSQFKWLLSITGILVAVVIMVMLGRIPVQSLLAPIVLALTFALRNVHLLIRLFPLLQSLSRRARAGGSGAGGDVSTIRTQFLAMELQHATGEMDGEILQGRFEGQRVAQLSVEQLLELAKECRADANSTQVLEAYLDRSHPDWREQLAAGSRQHEHSGLESAMTESLALEVLGLRPGANTEEIIAAHRKLMQKMHPDRGGSDYLARKINEARDFLLS
jgi:hypothetical protein